MIENAEICRLDRRRNAIVEAALSLFLEQGYERTTLGNIVERAGGSLATVYKLFGSKDGLLEEVVFEKASSGEALIADAVEQGGSPSEMLHRIAEGLHLHFLDPEVVALVRIVIARSVSDPDFAKLFVERTATRTRDLLERMFASWMASGVPMKRDPALLAEMFLGLFVSDLHSEAISHGIAVEHSSKRLRARVNFFIAGAGLPNLSDT